MATIQKKFLIDSRDRLTGTSENFTISLNGSYKIISFSLLELTITKAWYAVTTTNNYIDLQKMDLILMKHLSLYQKVIILPHN